MMRVTALHRFGTWKDKKGYASMLVYFHEASMQQVLIS
jgi:hypothetical protein